MTKRKMVMAALLVLLAAVTLLVLNRLTLVTPVQPVLSDMPEDAPGQKPFIVEMYDEERGVKRGQLIAASYRTLPDGAFEASDISMELARTEIGDVSLTCDGANLQWERSVQKLAGKVRLEGNIVLRSTRNGEPDVSGLFQEILFDPRTRDVSVTGPFKISSAQGVALSGTGMTGKAAADDLYLTVEKSVHLEIESTSLPPAIASSGRGRVTLDAGGPMVYDDLPKSLSFSGDVSIASGEMNLSGSALLLDLEPWVSEKSGEPRAVDAPQEGLDDLMGGMTLSSFVLVGPVLGHSRDFDLEGDRLYWLAGEGVGGLVGNPSRISAAEGYIEARSLEMRFDDDGRAAAVAAGGPGRAYFLGEEQEIDRESVKAPPRPSFTATWLQSLLYEAAGPTLTISGEVTLDAGAYYGTADRIVAQLEKHPAAAISALADDAARTGQDEIFTSIADDIIAVDAHGGVSLADAENGVTVTGDYASWHLAADSMTVGGKPATAAAENAVFSADVLSFDRQRRRLVAEGGCTVEIASTGVRHEAAEAAPLVVRAGRIVADVAEAGLDSECSGGVSVDWNEMKLTCDTLSLKGAGLDTQGDAARELEAGSVKVIGAGSVVFRSGDFNVKCGSFAFDRALQKLSLKPAPGGKVQVDFGDAGSDGDYATIWADGVLVETVAAPQETSDDVEGAARDTYIVTCRKPRAVLWVKGSFIGFRTPGPTDEKTEPAGKTKVDISAGGEMVLRTLAGGKGVLEFSEGVEVTRRNPSARLDDKLTAESLYVELAGLAGDQTPTVAEGEKSAVDLNPGKVEFLAARATGDVYVCYSDPSGTLEARGDKLVWGKDPDRAHLTGSPAKAWGSGTDVSGVQQAREFIYYFSDREIVVIGAERLVLKRAPPQ